jgi:hypothetical protein
VSSREGRAGNDDLGSRSVDDHDFTACLAAVVMLLAKHTPVCAAAGNTKGRLMPSANQISFFKFPFSVGQGV